MRGGNREHKDTGKQSRDAASEADATQQLRGSMAGIGCEPHNDREKGENARWSEVDGGELKVGGALGPIAIINQIIPGTSKVRR